MRCLHRVKSSMLVLRLMWQPSRLIRGSETSRSATAAALCLCFMMICKCGLQNQAVADGSVGRPCCAQLLGTALSVCHDSHGECVCRGCVSSTCRTLNKSLLRVMKFAAAAITRTIQILIWAPAYASYPHCYKANMLASLSIST